MFIGVLSSGVLESMVYGEAGEVVHEVLRLGGRNISRGSGSGGEVGSCYYVFRFVQEY